MILGVTGTIGAGKSTVCSLLKEKGVPVVDADKIGHRVLTYPAVKEKIKENFGDVFTEGEVDRKKLAQKVFSNKYNIYILNNITHPIIKEEIIKECQTLEKDHPLVACEVPLLYECGWERLFNKILVVYISKEETIKRLIKRGMTEKDALLRYENQMSPEKKVKKADFVISNEENLEKLALKVAQFLQLVIK